MKMGAAFPRVTIKISKDLGGWEGIERFRWDVYAAEVDKMVREVVGESVTIKTDFVDYGATRFVLDGVWDAETYRRLNQIFYCLPDLIDPSNERFYD